MKTALFWPGIFFLCCFTHLVFGQNTVKGKLLALPDSIPLSFVSLYVAPLNLYAESNAMGEFTLAPVPDGTYRVQLHKTGYKSQILALPRMIEGNLLVYMEPEIGQLNEIVVYGNQEELKTQTANNIEVMQMEEMRRQGAFNLSDGIAKLPGVTQLSTGPGISKPVIRGLNGNRIQTVLFGLRFDNQQWQDEHGLGLSDMGVEKVEILKGPSTLFYGSEAMGGIVNIIGEKPAASGKTESDVNTRFFSNTGGYHFDAGVKKSNDRRYFGIRIGHESHADYSDGRYKRILNSRFGGNVVKASFGFRRKHWQSENVYLFNYSHFGFLMDAYQLYDKADGRWARSFERPHHTVMVNLLSSQNNVQLKNSTLKINAGVHLNNRQEQEGSSGISLNMLLNTYAASFTWNKRLNARNEWSLGSQHQYQNNSNLGSRIIVPDAQLLESAFFVYLKNKHPHLVNEFGLRYDIKSIDTRLSGNLNSGTGLNPGIHILPVKRLYQTVNGCAGVSLYDNKHWNFKTNMSTGYRAPNLAELSSNGLHEGSVRYELGNVNLKVEQNFCTDAYLGFQSKQLSVFVDVFANRFLNYIFLQGSSKEYIGFTIYEYVQKNATLSGVEGGLKVHPSGLKWLQVNAVYSSVVGQTDAHEYLPFIPAQKICHEIKCSLPKTKHLHNAAFSLYYNFVFKQSLVHQFETPTGAYSLLNAAFSAELPSKRMHLHYALSANNLLNTYYYDHLSRFKYFGIYNMGRSFQLSLTFQFK